MGGAQRHRRAPDDPCQHAGQELTSAMAGTFDALRANDALDQSCYKGSG